MILSSRHSPDNSVEFSAWLAPKIESDLVFEPGFDIASGSDGAHKVDNVETSSEPGEFVVWRPGMVDEGLLLQTEALTAESTIEEIENTESGESEPSAQYTQLELQEYGENQVQLALAQVRADEAAVLSGTKLRLEALIATISEQRVDSTSFYDPLKKLLVKSVEAVLMTPLVESKASIESVLARLLKEVDSENEGEPAGMRLYLNPADVALLEAEHIAVRDDIKILSDPRLSQGSVRALMQDSIIEDLSEIRIQQITQQLLSGLDKKADETQLVDSDTTITETSLEQASDEALLGELDS